MFWRVAGLLTCTLSGLLAPASAQEMPVPVSIQIPLLLRVLPFDRNFEPASGGKLVVAIVYQEIVRNSYVVMRAASVALETAGSTPGGEAISVIPLPYSDRAGLLASLRSEKIDLIYISPLRGAAISGILDASEEAQILTSTGVPGFVEDGVAVGIGSRGGKPQIVINREASIAQGAEFSSELLKVARLISRPLDPVSVPFSHRE